MSVIVVGAAAMLIMLSPVLVMLGGMLFGLFSPYAGDNTTLSWTRATIHVVEIALEQYKTDIGHYPRGDFAAAVQALSDPEFGWERADFVSWFPKRAHVRDDAGNRRIPDAWDMDIHYCSHEEYESSGRGVERTPGKRDFYNPKTFQLYSTGPNKKTWPLTKDGGHNRLGGTEEDDIRNWEQDTFHKPADYR